MLAAVRSVPPTFSTEKPYDCCSRIFCSSDVVSAVQPTSDDKGLFKTLPLTEYISSHK